MGGREAPAYEQLKQKLRNTRRFPRAFSKPVLFLTIFWVSIDHDGWHILVISIQTFIRFHDDSSKRAAALGSKSLFNSSCVLHFWVKKTPKEARWSNKIQTGSYQLLLLSAGFKPFLPKEPMAHCKIDSLDRTNCYEQENPFQTLLNEGLFASWLCSVIFPEFKYQ